MKTALLFPGQGVQKVGMGKVLYEEFPKIKEIYDEADDLLGFSIKDISFNGPHQELTDSKNAQPAILLHSYAIYSEVKGKLDFSVVAGHSLGEYTAYLAAGTLDFDDALHLVRFRGELMSSVRNGIMNAIIGLDSEDVKKVVEEIPGIVVAANFNSPEQTVISGEVEAVGKASNELKKRGGRVIPLSVSGAFHSPLMEEVSRPFKKVLLKIKIKKPSVPVYSNVTAKKVTDPDEIRKTLGEQVLKPIQWVIILRNMKEEGVQRFIEIGQGKVLSKFVKSTLGKVETLNISSPKQIRRFLGE
ncbi:MAG: ACP S-malonyltransferase [candidate division WOR-3 bacterium]|nr:ACP S-malonyltransferase [candidate division WOR-3 bacterium]